MTLVEAPSGEGDKMTKARIDRTPEVNSKMPVAGTNKSKPALGRRFQPGQSGNPSGRPAGARSRALVVKAVMAEVHEVGIGSHRRKLTTLDLILLRLRQRALSGERDAVRAFHRYLETYAPQQDV
jgi:hypothetical protein